MRRHHWTVIAGGVSAALPAAWVVWATSHLHRGMFKAGRSATIDRRPSLNDVVEPITILDAMSFDDGGSQGLRFRDASGVVREICPEDTRVWEDDPSASGGHHDLILNSFSPRGENARGVAVAGAEERQVLGLLDRWARRDPDANLIESRYDRYARGEIDIEAFWKGLPAEAHPKVTAVSILRELRGRN